MDFKNFISANTKYCDLYDWVPAPYIRKNFKLPFTAEKAHISVCVPCFYELYLNGEKITKGEMAPYINNPDHLCYYDTYDVTGKLSAGENAVGLILGNGFANQCTDQWNFSKAPFRSPLSVSLVLEAECGAERFCLESDESFKTHPSPVLFDMYRYGIYYDARLEIAGWCSPGFDDTNWENVHIVPAPRGEQKLCTTQPVRHQYELEPVSIEHQKDFCYLHTSTAPGAAACPETYVKEGWLYDFGVSRTGLCRLKIKGKKGQKITLRHGEYLREGKFCLNSIYTFKEDYADYIHLFQTDTYVLKGGEEEIFMPFFTYHGFRYVLVEGIREEQATKDLLTFVVFNSDIPKRADFACSDETLNTLYQMGIHADLSNFVYFPTDCPHREKNGWTGDAAASANQYLLNFDCSESFRVWMESIRKAQLENGMIPGIVPTADWGYKWGSGPFWDSVIVKLPYYALLFDGRTDLIEENADLIIRYLHYIAGRRDEKGLVHCGLGDWCQPFSGNRNITSPLEFTDSATVFDMAQKGAKLLRCIGRNADAQYAEHLAGEMKAAIREHLMDPKTLTIAGNCQTSQAYALALGIFEEPERAEAYQRLLDFIEVKDRHIDCGLIGLCYIFHLLFENGDGELAYEMITREDAPSYGYMVKAGGTALFEALHFNGVQESQNHHFFGDILNLFISKLAGLVVNPGMDDKDRILVKPYVIRQVDWARASYHSEHGRICVSWEKIQPEVQGNMGMPGNAGVLENTGMPGNAGVFFKVEVPEGIHGDVEIAGKIFELKTGLNEFRM